MFLSLYRIIKFSLQDIVRNIWLSIVTITILVLALFSINVLLVTQVIGNTAIDAVKAKIDVGLDLRQDAGDEEIMALQTTVANLSQVSEVRYVSKEDALENFRIEFGNNPRAMEALQEIGKNPLSPSLIIKPANTDVVDQLINELNKIDSEIIESRNFSDHKIMLDKINAITDKVNSVGMAISIIFGLIFFIIIFNSLRISIYTHRKEIAIMKLVGASNYFVYMPFLLSGFIYAVVGVGFILALFYPFLSLLQPYLEAFFIGYDINIIEYFNNDFWPIFGLQFLGVATINILASLIAVRKYAKV